MTKLLSVLALVALAVGLTWFAVDQSRHDCESRGGRIDTVSTARGTVCVAPDGKLLD